MNTTKSRLKLTEEKVKEVFSVPETERLLECLLKQEEQKIESLSRIVTKLLIKEYQEAKRRIEGIIKKRIIVIAVESEKGEKLDEAVQKTIKQQLKNPTVIEKITVEINNDCCKVAANFLGQLIEKIDKL